MCSSDLTAGAALTPSSIVANPQSFVGASDVPPIVANYDVLYVQSKGSAIRDLAFNIYFNTFTAYLGATSNGVPTVPGFVQQRLFLGGLLGAPQTFYLSRPGSYFNFDISQPTRADDSISATLVSGTLNNIKSVVPSNSGMLVLTDKASWVVNGGTAGAALTPSIVTGKQIGRAHV